jgi:hypothetical protein
VSRKSLSKRTRFEVFKRDDFACQYCGRHPPDVFLEVDHITPVCDGGGDDEGNLITACFDCNRGKAGISLAMAPKGLSEKAAEIQEREAQLQGYRDVIEAQQDRIDTDMWDVADALVKGSREKGMRRDWLRSIKTFNDRLSLHVVLDAAELAWAKKPYSEKYRFLYFCGICWNKIREGKE